MWSSRHPSRHLEKWFGEGKARTYAVRNVSFEAGYGKMLYIVGPSSSGKTTLLSMISGILRPMPAPSSSMAGKLDPGPQ